MGKRQFEEGLPPETLRPQDPKTSPATKYKMLIESTCTYIWYIVPVYMVIPVRSM